MIIMTVIQDDHQDETFMITHDDIGVTPNRFIVRFFRFKLFKFLFYRGVPLHYGNTIVHVVAKIET